MRSKPSGRVAVGALRLDVRRAVRARPDRHRRRRRPGIRGQDRARGEHGGERASHAILGSVGCQEYLVLFDMEAVRNLQAMNEASEAPPARCDRDARRRGASSTGWRGHGPYAGRADRAPPRSRDRRRGDGHRRARHRRARARPRGHRRRGGGGPPRARARRRRGRALVRRPGAVDRGRAREAVRALPRARTAARWRSCSTPRPTSSPSWSRSTSGSIATPPCSTRSRRTVKKALSDSRQDLLRQFSAQDGHNPLADFKASVVQAVKRSGDCRSG